MSPSPAALVELAAELDIDAAALAAVEAAAEINHTFNRPGAVVAQITADRAAAFIEEYGDAATIDVRTGDLHELSIAPGMRAEDLEALRARAGGGGPYEVELTIDKDRLESSIVGPSPARECRLFFFSDALRRVLSHGVRRFEQEVWQQAPAPLVITVLDTDVNLTGPHLSILGGADTDASAEAAAATPPETDFDALYVARDRHVGWDSTWNTALTPWHFQLTGSSADADLGRLLDAQLVKLAVLFTSDRVRTGPTPVPPPVIRAEYRGQAHFAVLRIDERSPVDITSAEAAAVLAGVDWCYRRRGANGEPDWVSDRLPFLQTRIAQTLEPRPEEDRVAALAQAMPYILDGIDWHWKAFVEGKVGDYLDLVRSVEETVADTVISFSDRAAALVKSLGEATLAAVAVLVGTFIAAAFKEPFNATLFELGLRAYAGYVLVFPGAVGLLASFYALRVTRASFNSRVSRFKETLHPEKVDSVVGKRVEKAERSYYVWLGAVALIYVLVAAAAWRASTEVPRRLRDAPAAITPTTPPPTTEPSTTTTPPTIAPPTTSPAPTGS